MVAGSSESWIMGAATTSPGDSRCRKWMPRGAGRPLFANECDRWAGRWSSSRRRNVVAKSKLPSPRRLEPVMHSGTIRIAIADDHPIFRDGLRRLLESEPNLQVVGEAADG